ncbi:homocysteine S-methyltransferase family protein [Ethanoligenens sp.]|uniref:homocysteine S-methyltransferase family protein n=1 Tax=Ethanoligenens sp. TaxID=2099655 RepID=UPI0039E95D2A
MRVLEDIGKRIVFFDGGMGTMLQANGLAPGEQPELWNLTHRDIIFKIHSAYRAAGAEIIKTNTFGANRFKYQEIGVLEQVITEGVRVAKEAAGEGGLVAMDIGPTGKLMEPLGDLPFELAVKIFGEAAAIGEKAGADLILIETMTDTYECKAAVLAAKERTNLPVFATLVSDDKGKLLTGGDIPAAVALLEGLGVDALGLNCGFGPDLMRRLLPAVLECASVPVIINPNAGLPQTRNGQTIYTIKPEEFAAEMREIALGGAWIIGGCCGTTPDYTAAEVQACKDITPVPLVNKKRTVISSYAKAVVFGETAPVLIGERINPTGKSRLKQALRDGDIDYILQQGIEQMQLGAHVLDVNVGLPELDEPAVMEQVVSALQGVVDIPLQIDTSSPEAMEKALRLYSGKALINSVNGKEESMHSIFPLVKKYGGVVVALTLDENGIPPTAEGRVAVARKIMETAASYGIGPENLLVDTLVMTISAGQENAAVTLEALERIRRELGLRTSLGVSNVAFGLPEREKLNAAFFTMALQRGLDAAIINPKSQGMMDVYRAYRALSGKDKQCMDYIAAYGGQQSKPTPPTNGEAVSLFDAIVTGLKTSASDAAKTLAEKERPLDIIEKNLIPALDRVGHDFEIGTLFLPQLLMSAEAARAAFEVLREKMDAGEQKAQKAKVILATVKGDIHDIGKNIVKILLQNYSYEVIDLGKNVPPSDVVEIAQKERVKLVGLSALMTTTVENMAETIRQLRQSVPKCKIMVGGAVLNAEYADQIGADFYAKDAMGAVHYAELLFTNAGV